MSGYTVSYWTTNESTLDSGASFYIQDSAANIQAALASLAQDSHISAIVVQDGPGAEVSVSVAQLTSAAAAIAILQNPSGATAPVIVADTAANIGSHFAAIAIDSQVGSIVVSNNANVTLSASQVGNNTSAISKLVNANASAASLIVKDNAANIAANLAAIETVVANVYQIVVSNNTQITLTASQVANDATALGAVRFNNGTTTNLFKVSDTAANIAANLAALASNTKITAITISDNAAVQTTVATLTSDAVAIGKLANANAGAYVLEVVDNASNLSAALATLAANTHVRTIVVSDSSALTVSVAQLSSDAAALAVTQNQGGGAYTLLVSDTAAAIGADLAALNGNTHVANIEVQSGTVALSSVAALTTYATALGKLHQPDGVTQAQVVVTDVAANISAALNSLHADSQILKLVVSDSASNRVVCSVAQLASDSDVLAKLYDADGSTSATVTVTDTGADLSGAALGATASNALVAGIVVSSGNVALSVAQFNADTTGLGELENPDASAASIWISDTATAIDPVLSSLDSDSQVARIVVTSGEVQVDATTAASAPDLAKLYTSGGALASVSVSDTGATLSSDLDALAANSRVNAIVDSDAATLTLSASQVANDANALNEIQGSYSVAVSDLAANVATDLDQLQANGHVASIALTDGGAPTLTVSQTRFAQDAATIGEITGSFSLDVVSVTVAEVGAVESDYSDLSNHANATLSIAVADTAADLTDTALTALGSNADVQAITVSSGTLALTEAQFLSDLAGLGKITGAWSIAVSGATVAGVTTVETDFTGLGNSAQGALALAVADIGSNLTNTALGALGADTHVASIAVSSGTISLTKIQFETDLTDLAKIVGAWSLQVTAVDVASVATVESDLAGLANAANATLSIAVSDVAGNLTSSALAALGADSHVQSIAIAAGALTLTQAQFDAAATLAGLAKITGAWSVDVSGVSVAGVATVENAFAALGNHGSGSLSIAVSDNSIALTFTALSTLGADARVQSIAANGPLLLSDQELESAAGLAGLAKLIGSWQVYVDGVAVSGVSALETAFTGLGNSGAGTLTITVVDSAANLTSAALVSLGADSYVAAIGVSSGTISLTEAQFNAAGDLAGLAKISNYTVDLTAVAAADAASLGANTHVGTIVVSDTAANIRTNLDALNGVAKLVSIIISDNAALAMTAYAATHDATAIGLLANANSTAVSLTVSDTAANIALYFSQLNGESNISSIVVSDNASLSLTAAQIADTATLAKLSNADASGVVIDVTDTAANISANLGSLESEIDSEGYVSQVTISNNASITVTLAQRISDQTVLGLLANANNSAVTLIVGDTAANILANSATLAQDTEVTQVRISDNAPLLLSVAQYQGDANLFVKLANANGSPYVIDIADNATNIASALTALSADTHVARINVSGNASLNLNVAAITTDAAGLAKTYNATDSGASTYTLTVTDTAANLSAALGSLSANSHVARIVASDNASLNVSVAAIAADATALSKTYNASDVGASTYTLEVTDTASDLSTAFDALNANSRVTRIVVSDSAQHAVTISAASALADTVAEGELYQANGVTAASVDVSDVASTIASDLNALNGNAAIQKILVSDAGTVAVSAASALADTTAEGKLYQADGVTAAPVTVSDTASTISADFDSLNSAAHIGAITVSGGGALTLTRSQFLNDTTALGELQGAYQIAVSLPGAYLGGMLAALQSNGHVSSITISDNVEGQISLINLSADATVLGELHNADASTPHVVLSDGAAGIAAAFDTLNGDALINKIDVADSSSAHVTVSAAEAASDSTAIGELYNFNGSTPVTIYVSDTAADLASAFDALNANAAVSRILVADNAPVGLTVASALADTTAEAMLYQENGITAAGVAVSDTASAISNGFDALNADAHVDAITVVSGGAVGLTRTQFLTDVSALGKLQGAYQLAVSTAGAYFGGILDSLESNGHVVSVTMSDNQEGQISLLQLTNDASVLGELHNANASTAHVVLEDGAASLAAAFDSLNSDSLINQINVADSSSATVTLTAAQAANDTTALSELRTFNGATTVTVAVSDTASDIAADFGALNGNAAVGRIIVADSATHQVTLTAAVAVADTVAEGELYQADNATLASIEVLDTASDIQSRLDALEANTSIQTIVVSDGQPIDVSIQTFATDTDAIGLLLNPNQSAFKVTIDDTAAHITSDLVGLAGDASEIAAIVVSDGGTLTVPSIAAFTADAPALGLLTGSYGLAVADAAGAITGTALDSLETYAAAGHLVSLTVNGNGAVGVNVARITSDAQVLAHTANANATPYTLAVTDTAADVAAGLDALAANSHVSTITLTDPATVMTISLQQDVNDNLFFSAFTNGYHFHVTGVTAYYAAAVASDPHVASFSMADYAATIDTDLDNLETYSADITGVTLTDASVPTLTVSYAQLTSDASFLQKIGTPFHLAVTGVTAANASNVATLVAGIGNANASVTSIAIVDNSAAVQTNFAALTALESTIGSVTFTDGSPALTLTKAQYEASAALRASFATAYALTVTGAAAADVTALAADPNLAHVSIVDSAANVQSVFSVLNGLAAKVSSVTFNGDPDLLTLTEAQYNASSTLRGVFSGDYNFEVTGVAAGDVAGLLEGDGRIEALAVSDTSSAVQANFATLEANAALIASVSFTDASPSLTLTATQYALAAPLLAEFSGAYSLSVTGVSVAAAIALAANSHVTALTISDSSSAVQSNYATLTAIESKIGSVSFTDGSPALTMTGAQYDASASLRAAFTESYALTVTGASATDLTALAADPNLVQLSVVDSAADISQNFATLNGLAAKVTSVTFTDVSPSLTLTTAAYLASSVLREVFPASYVLSLTGALAGQAVSLAADPHVTQIGIVDQSQAVQTNLSALIGLGSEIASVTFTDGSPSLSLTQSQYNSATALRAALQGSYALAVTGVAAGYAGVVAANAHVNQISVADTSANVQNYYSILTALGAEITSLTFTDGSPALILNETQYNASSALRAAFQGTYSLTVSYVLAADAATVGGDSHVASLSIYDTGAQVQSALATLVSLGGRLGSITLDDAQSPTLTLTEAQYSADWSTLSKIVSPFDLALTGVAAADVANLITTVEGDGNVHALTISVSDTAAQISAALDTLNAPEVQSVTISDNGALAFSASEAVNGASALGKLANQNGQPISLAISDTAANISADFSSLAGIADLASVAVSDNAVLTLTGLQVLNGAATLAKTADADGSSPTIDVVDTAADLETAGVLDALEANNDVASIVVSGGPLVVDVAEFVADSDVIGEMTTSTDATLPVTVTDTVAHITASLGLLTLEPQVTAIRLTAPGQINLSVAQLLAYQTALGELQNATLTVKDTAAALRTALDSLQALGSSVNSVVVSNNLPLTVSATQVSSDAATLAKLSNRSGASVVYNVADTGANVAAAITALTAQAAHVGSITLTSGAVSVSAATYQANYAALDKIVGGFTIADSATSIAALFDTINADAHVDAVTLTDAGTPVLNLSPASAAADTTALADIANPLFEVLTSQGGAYYANGAGQNNAQLVVTDNSVHVVEKTATNLEVVGQNDTVTAAANATLAVSGSAMTVNAGAGDVVTLFAGTGDLFTGSNDSLTIAGAVGLTISGSADAIAIGANDTLTLAGPQTLAAAVSGAGTLAISGGAIAVASGTTLAMAALSETGGVASLAGDLAYSGAFTQSAGATLSEATGHTLTLSGGGTVAGTLSGAGTLSITGGTTSIASTAKIWTTTMTVQGSSTTLTLAGINSRTSNFSVGGGATINLAGGYLNLFGTGNSLANAEVIGAHSLSNYGALAISTLTVGGTASLSNNANITQSGGVVTVGDSAASTAQIVNQAAGVWNFVDDSGIAAATSALKMFNYGLLEKTAGTGTSTIAAALTSSATLTTNSGTLALTGTGDKLSSSITGSGTLAIAGGSSTIAAATTLSVANLAETGASTILTVGTNAYAGSFTQGAGATLTISAASTFTLSGTSILNGTISGSGALTLAGGTTTVSASTKLWSTTMSVQGASTVLNVAGAAARTGNFTVTGGATLNLSGSYWSAFGTGNNLANAKLLGSKTFANYGTLRVATVTVGGSAVLQNNLTLDQSGGTVTLGNSGASTAKITNQAAGTYDITDNSGVASASTSARFVNAGLVEKTGGTGDSVIAAVFANTGRVVVSSGELEFGAGVTGAGTETISGAATLAFDSSVGSGAAIAFTGSGGDLKLGNAHGFAGVLSGFDTTGSSDAITLLGKWSSAGFTENGGHTQGVLHLTNGTQTASLTLSGNYASNFHVAAGGGLTTVTYG